MARSVMARMVVGERAEEQIAQAQSSDCRPAVEQRLLRREVEAAETGEGISRLSSHAADPGLSCLEGKQSKTDQHAEHQPTRQEHGELRSPAHGPEWLAWPEDNPRSLGLPAFG